MLPENPAKNFPRKVLIEVNRAYCVAVYLRFVRLERYAMNTVPAKPMVKLSALIAAVSTEILGPEIVRPTKKRFVEAIRMVAAIMHFGRPNFNIAVAPNAVPISEIHKPYIFATLAISDFEKPISSRKGVARIPRI